MMTLIASQQNSSYYYYNGMVDHWDVRTMQPIYLTHHMHPLMPCLWTMHTIMYTWIISVAIVPHQFSAVYSALTDRAYIHACMHAVAIVCKYYSQIQVVCRQVCNNSNGNTNNIRKSNDHAYLILSDAAKKLSSQWGAWLSFSHALKECLSPLDSWNKSQESLEHL